MKSTVADRSQVLEPIYMNTSSRSTRRPSLIIRRAGDVGAVGVFIALLCFNPLQAADTSPAPTTEVAALQAELAALKSQLPDQAHAMADVGYHFANLWFAGKAANWPLAQFYLGETKSHLEWAVRLKPVRKTQAGNLDLNGILQAIENTQLTDLKKTLDARDGVAFGAAYRTTLEACYACHKASEKPYLRPQIPEVPPATILNFKPDATWPQ
jgi:hypothetical protein